MIERIEHLGKLIDDCTIQGERRADQVAPAHGNGIQLSRTRFLVLNSTLRFRGVDDNASIVWQLREDNYDGSVIKEGLFARCIDDWYPLGDKYRCVRQHGHPVAFGVPKGALVRGEEAPHANVFTVKWRKVARVFVPEGGYIMWQTEPREVRAATQCVEWCQFRLNDAEDDIEIIQEPRQLRQVGYEEGEAICEQGCRIMNQSYVQPVSFNADANEWVDVNHFNLHTERTPAGKGGKHGNARVAPLRYRFNADRGLYEWVQTGPLWGRADLPLFEGNISRFGDDWVMSARRGDSETGVAWARVHDPFMERPEAVIPEDVKSRRAPLSAYCCPDRVIRLCTGDETLSAHASNRDPIFIWDIDPDHGFTSSNRRQIYSPRECGNPIPEDHGPLADMIKVLPHVGGRTQTLIHRVRTCAMAVKEADYPSRIRPLTEGDFVGTAIYHAHVHYAKEHPGVWAFE